MTETVEIFMKDDARKVTSALLLVTPKRATSLDEILCIGRATESFFTDNKKKKKLVESSNLVDR